MSLSPSQQGHGQSILVRNRLTSRLAHVAKDLRAGLHALLLSILTRINARILWGLGWMGVVAPLAACCYMLMDQRAVVEGWYHVNYFHLFLVLAPSLFVLASLVGVWFLFPYRSARGYMLAVPGGYTIGKILWLIQCTSNADFYSIVPTSFVLLGGLISIVLFLSLDWLTHRAFHREAAFESRMDGLIASADNLTDAQFKAMVCKTWSERQAFEKSF